MFSGILGRIGLSDLPSSFQYALEEVSERPPASVFEIYNGHTTKGPEKYVILHHYKHSRRPVSIFVCNRKTCTVDEFEGAARAMKKARSIKHPSFIPVYDVRFINIVEQFGYQATKTSSAVYIATPSICTLPQAYSDPNLRDIITNCAPWILYIVAKGIAFLHQEVQACHGSLSPYNIFFSTDSGKCRSKSSDCFRPLFHWWINEML